MIKKVLLMASMLMPGLAYGGNPSADLSVQVVPAASTPVVPVAAQAAGFTTLALNSDWTTPIPNATLPSNWLGCYGDTGQHIWYQGINNGTGTQVPCNTGNNVLAQATDPDLGGVALNMRYDSANDALVAPFLANQIQTANVFGGQAGADGVGQSYPIALYAEVRFRIRSNPLYGSTIYLPGGADAAAWSQSYTSTTCGGNGLEFDYIEMFFQADLAGDSNVLAFCGGGGGSPYDNHGTFQWDPRQYHTYAMRITQDGSGNGGVCSYLDGTLMRNGSISDGNGCRSYSGWNANGQLTLRSTPTFSLGTTCFHAAAGGGVDFTKTCLNAPLTNVYDCSGKICITSPKAAGTTPRAGITGVVGNATLQNAVNGTEWYLDRVGANTSTNQDWILRGSTWPAGGSYTSGGMLNKYTQIDAYVQWYRIWTCADWNNQSGNYMCAGAVLKQ